MGLKNVKIKNRLGYLTRLINGDLYYMFHKQPKEGHFILCTILCDVWIVIDILFFAAASRFGIKRYLAAASLFVLCYKTCRY